MTPWTTALKLAASGLALLALGACQTTGGAETYKKAFAHGQASPQAVATTGDDAAQDNLDAYELADLRPGERPDITSAEAGLWMAMDNAERDLATSGNRVTDPVVTTYIENMVCRIAGDYCNDFRVYVVRSPMFNASMAPNGTMIVFTGLLLRTDNEAQVAAVIGHEIAHYLRRHSVQRMKDVVDKTNALIFIQMASALSGVGFVGDLAALGTLGSIQAFSRDHEREADGYGLALMVRAGYDPREAAKIWQRVIRLKNATPDMPQYNAFLATHPASDERDKALMDLATTVENSGELRTGRHAHREALKDIWFDLFRDELANRQYSATLELLDMLAEDGNPPAYVHFIRGEVYRLRGNDGDMDLALSEYRKSAAEDLTPAELYRSQGLLLKRQGRITEARASLKTYLQLVPDAPDRAIIESMTQGAL